jgi:acyl dehydratase
VSAAAAVLAVDDERATVVVENLSRTRIVQYAGASGDFNPVHTDELFATGPAGSPSVFAHGMLTMGMAARVVTDWFGPEALLSYRVRFRAPVYPGATLTATARVAAVGDSTARLDLTMTDADGLTVMTGEATVRNGAEAGGVETGGNETGARS